MSQNLQKTFQKRIKELRESLDFTQDKMAKELFISRSCWSNYETGNRSPKLDMIQRIANFFKIDITYLLKDSGTNDNTDEFMKYYLENSKYISKNGCLNLSKLSPMERIILVEHYRYLLVRKRY